MIAVFCWDSDKNIFESKYLSGTAWPKMHVCTKAKVKADFVMLSCMYCKNAVKIGLGNVVLYKWKETPRAFCTSAIFPRIFE